MCDSTKFFEGVWLMCIGLGLMLGATLNLYGLDALEKIQNKNSKVLASIAYRNGV